MGILGQKCQLLANKIIETIDVNNTKHQIGQANQLSGNLYNLVTIEFQPIPLGENRRYP
jgi:hypothetical protein